MLDIKYWIIIAVVLGTLVLLLVLTLGLFFWKRSKRRIRGFSLRAVTPLDDAEFESWRRPSEYTKRPVKYGIRPKQEAAIRSEQTSLTMFEKELNCHSPRTPSPPMNEMPVPMSPIRKPERVQRKTSDCSSLAERPPTPYSPALASPKFRRYSSHSSRKSGSTPHAHYPSMSEASAFEFNFGPENSSPPDYSHQSDCRPLSYSYARHDGHF